MTRPLLLVNPVAPIQRRAGSLIPHDDQNWAWGRQLD